MLVVEDLQLLHEDCERWIRRLKLGGTLSFLRDNGKDAEQGAQIFTEADKCNPPEL